MGSNSNIQWTDATWNLARGCHKVDADCKNCYMYRDSFNGTRYQPREVVRTKTVFDMPLRYNKTRSDVWLGPPLIFTCSLTDFFIEEIDSYRDEAWDIIRKRKDLIFQILTKRPERIRECLPDDWGDGWDNVWLGTSIGSRAGLHRLEQLVKIPANTRFLSIEPLHERIDMSHFDIEVTGIDWVIIGGESGHKTGKYKYRPCELKWIEDLLLYFRWIDTPVFVKQLGTHLAEELGLKDRHGGDINEFPEHLRVRQFPAI